jgi:hypothetical protein
LRSVPSEVLQLQKLATKIRSTQRQNVDSFEKNTKCNDSNFKKSCSQTGGGAGDDFPPGKEYLFSYLTLLTSIFPTEHKSKCLSEMYQELIGIKTL